MIKVAGHRLGTKEIENAALTTEEVAEAAAVALVDELSGHVPIVYVSLKPGYAPSKELEEKIKNNVTKELGPIARPKSCLHRPRPPEDAVREDNAPDPGVHLREQGLRRREHAGQRRSRGDVLRKLVQGQRK